MTYHVHGLFLPYLINKTATLLNHQLQDILDAQGLTLTHWRVLAFLSTHDGDGLTVGALAEATMTEQSTLSRSLRNLELQGYTARRTGLLDSRVAHIHLSESGRNAFEAMLVKALQVEAASTAGVSAEEVEMVRSVLLRIIGNTQK